MMGYGFGLGGIGMVTIMIVIAIVPVGLGIALLATLFPRVAKSSMISGPVQQGNAGPSATEILKQRYARGEISTEQFNQMRRDVEG